MRGIGPPFCFHIIPTYRVLSHSMITAYSQLRPRSVAVRYCTYLTVLASEPKVTAAVFIEVIVVAGPIVEALQITCDCECVYACMCLVCVRASIYRGSRICKL